MTAPIRVLFLCTHNSARSQIAEALLRHLGGDAFAAFSAGTEATRVHPLALSVLQEHGIDATGLSSKSLARYLGQQFDVVVTVCDVANESCPIFPGDPERIHWSLPDPSAAEGTDAERRQAFGATYLTLRRRLPLFIEAQRNARQTATKQPSQERPVPTPAPTLMFPVSVIDDPSCAPPVPVIHPGPHDVARFKALADETRLTLLLTLLHADVPVCVCNLLPAVGVGQATVSHHLKVLREAGLVAVERRGIWAHYAVTPDVQDWLRAVLS